MMWILMLVAQILGAMCYPNKSTVLGKEETGVQIPSEPSRNSNFHWRPSMFPGAEDGMGDKCVNETEDKMKTYSSLYSYLTGTGAHSFNDTITLGFITPYNHNQFSLGAMRLAVEKINKNPQLLPHRSLNYIAADIGSSDLQLTRPIRIMTKMRDEGTIAFIGGPEDTCVSEALVAAAWNLPMISYKCSDQRVSDKNTYTTFARTLPPSSKVSKSVVALLKQFQWNKIVLIVCHGKRDRWYQVIIDAFKFLSEKHEINITDHHSLPDFIPENFPLMERIVDQSYKNTRVYVFIGEHVALVYLIRAMAKRKLFDHGEYIVISVDDKIDLENFFDVEYLEPYLKNETNNLSEAYRSVLKLSLSHPRKSNYGAIEQKIAIYSTEDPFCVPYHHRIFTDAEVPVEAAYLYDAVMIYARALHETIEAGRDPRDGSAIQERIRNRSYTSVRGYEVFIDGNGDAEGNYTVISYISDKLSNNDNGTEKWSMQPVGYFQQTSGDSPSPEAIPFFKYFDDNRPIDWVGGKPPKSEPKCGFRGEKCVYKPDWKTIVGCSFFASIIIIITVLAVRHYRYEQKLACLLWKIDMKDVIIPTTQPEPIIRAKRTVALCRQLLETAVDSDVQSELSSKRAYTRIGFYKGMTVAIKPIHKRSVDLTRNIRKELKQIRECRHENIIPFIGASVDHGNICILTAYCARGSLEDVLQNEDLHLDNMFIASLVADLIKGMIYLHDSEIISHGNLKSSNCLVDSRWVLQISDFGLHEFKGGQEIQNLEEESKKLLWKAPELLRDQNAHPRGSQKGDVYSFGIILYEMIGRAGPWGNTNLSVSEIVDRVAHPKLSSSIKYTRPSMYSLECSDTIRNCIEACWEEDPDARPDFRFIRVRLKEMQAGLKPNIFDNMLSIMEKYACNLEELVQERTRQLVEEKKKTDALLHRMLPKSVSDSLKRGEPVEAETFDSVTIYFSDIVGFTELSAVSTPMQVVELLNDLYTCFDSIISNYDVYKVETIGDAYMVVSGLPIRNGDQHAGEVASMAVHLLNKLKNFKIPHRPGERLKLRIGIHSGPVVAGVVGLKMPRYCLFGDTVNTASRMESSGAAFKIHISDVTKGILEKLKGYHYESRGLVPIKGKGEMFTYWLLGEEGKQVNQHLTEDFNPAELKKDLMNSDFIFNSPSIANNDNKLLTYVNTSASPQKCENQGAADGKEETVGFDRMGGVVDADQNFHYSDPIYKPTAWLLNENSATANDNGNILKNIGGKYVSCSNVIQECKANIIKELRKNNGTILNGSRYPNIVNNASYYSGSCSNRFRSAPIITFMENVNAQGSTPMLYEEPHFV